MTDVALADDISVVPDDGIDITPDQEIAVLDALDLASAAPIEPESEPFGRSWNFNANVSGDATQFVYGVDSVRVWAETVVQIARFSSAIVDEHIGLDGLDEMVGQIDSPEIRGVSETDIEEALLVHDRITGVGDFVWEAADEALLMSATIEIDGDEEVRLTAVPVGMEAS